MATQEDVFKFWDDLWDSLMMYSFQVKGMMINMIPNEAQLNACMAFCKDIHDNTLDIGALWASLKKQKFLRMKQK